MPFIAGVFQRLKNWTTDAANGVPMQAPSFDLDANDMAAGLTQVYALTGSLSNATNVAVNGTPSNWGTTGNLQLPAGGTFGSLGNGVNLYSNAYYNGGWNYSAAGASTGYAQASGVHTWYTAASGVAGAPITYSTSMFLDATGTLYLPKGQIVLGSLGTDFVVAVDGSNNAYFRGTTLSFQNVAATQTFFSVAPAGSTFMGVATTTNAMSSQSGAVTVDCSKSNVHSFTLTGNMTGLTMSNIQDGQTVNIQITQDATGSRTMAGVTSANGYIWPNGTVGILSTAAGSIDLLVVTKVGTKLLTTIAKGFA